MKKLILAILLLLLFAGCTNNNLYLNPGVGSENYYRIDLKSEDKQAPLENLRIVTKGCYKFVETDEKYHLDENYVVDETGLNELNISGSGQYSKEQFVELSNKLKETAKDKKIYIIDLRRENHGFVNGYPVSYYSKHNWTNKTATNKEILDNQEKYFANLKNKNMTVFLKGDDEKSSEDYVELKVNECLNEKELVETLGFEYINIPCADYVWPSEENIDTFIEFVKTIDINNSWLYFHSETGKGRTGIFMCLYDMMKNPNVSLKSIAYRQTKMGSNYPLYIQSKDDWKKELFQEIADNFVLLYTYVQENYKDNYQISWSDWLKDNKDNIDCLNVSMLPLLSNMDYAKQLLVEMWGEIEPNIKLEFVDTSYYETQCPSSIDVQVRQMENVAYRIGKNHYRQLYKDEIHNYDDLISFAKENMVIDNKIYGIPQLLCDNFFFYYKDDTKMSEVNNTYELSSLLKSNEGLPKEVISNTDKIYYDKHSYVFYALDAAIDENETYIPFSSLECSNKEEDIYLDMKEIVDNGIYSSSDLKNIEEFAKGSGRGIFCYSEDLYFIDSEIIDKLKIKKISFAEEKDIPLMYIDQVCISEHVKDEVKFSKCLKLVDLLTSKEYIEKLLFIDGKPQYFIPVLESVFENCKKYPLYNDLYEIVNDSNLKLARCDNEDIKNVTNIISDYRKAKESK